MKGIRYLNLVAALALVLAALPMTWVAKAEAAAPDLRRDMQFVPGEAVVGFQAGLDQAAYTAQAAALADTVGAQVVKQNDDLALISFSPDADVAAMVDQLSAQDGVAFAEPNYVAFAPDAINATAIPVMTVERPTTGGETLILTADELRAMRTMRKVGTRMQAVPTYPNDFSNNWSWVKVSTDIIWPDKAANPAICVVDTGVDASHPDLKGYVINGQDYVDGDLVPMDDNGHGTHVAGTIAARMNNGAGTIAGISIGKIVAVKVLNSQGFGTTFDVASGLNNCVAKGAKIINLSLGGYSPSLALYNALNTVENTKGLLVVAAAGNDSTSDYFFPAAWASSNVCKDGGTGPCAAGNENALAPGLLSVGAARSLQTKNNDSTIWVDANGNGTEQSPDEDPGDCATSFSNYGDWVSMVAPGEDILSTTPYSAPFYMNYYQGVTAGYAALSGTSMAAAHVSGAAARVWSIGSSLFGTFNKADVKTQLITKGNPLNIMEDPNWGDHAIGYADSGYQGDGPFCWPSTMSSATYLNVATAMQRMSIGAVLVLDATMGLPLQDASVTVNKKGTTAVLDTAKVPATTPFVDFLNIPANKAFTYEVKVNKKNYTTGAVKIGEMAVDPSMAGSVWSGDNLSIGVPKLAGINVVATWFNKQAYVPTYGQGQKRDLDLYAWTPPNGLSLSPSTNTKAIIGPKETLWNSPGVDNYVYFGSLLTAPFARSFFDGGSGDANPSISTPVGLESISLKASTVVSKLSPFISPYYVGNYTFIVTDGGSGKLNNSSYPVILTVWTKGVPRVAVTLPDCTGHNAWKAVTINAFTYTLGTDPSTACGDFSEQPYPGLWPYH